MLKEITPVILTFNEAPNIKRTLAALDWAREIVVVDSGSTDGTLDILKEHPNVRLYYRAFDTHWNQWQFAIAETAITTKWLLRLDADYLLSPALVAEMGKQTADAPHAAFQIGFDYTIFGHKLISSFYPPNTVLFRAGQMEVYARGHTEGWRPRGSIGKLNARIIHDDRKPQKNWISAQARYMALELDHLDAGQGGIKNWLRRIPPVMPIIAFFYCLFGKGLILNGKAGLFYTLQRCIAEMVLSLMLLERRLDKDRRQ
jgi:glycosyltransferase involved in cell wall biosynthesis